MNTEMKLGNRLRKENLIVLIIHKTRCSPVFFCFLCHATYFLFKTNLDEIQITDNKVLLVLFQPMFMYFRIDFAPLFANSTVKYSVIACACLSV